MTRKIVDDVRKDIKDKFISVLGDSFRYIDEKPLIDYAVENAFEKSGVKDDGIYSAVDINLAVQRSIAHHLFDASNAETRVNSLTQSILEETTDYEWLDLTDHQLEIIFEKTEDVYGRDDVELTINKSLLNFGYEFDPEHFKWVPRVTR